MNIFDAAHYILESVGGNISAMKLHKLCYYSQAWSLAWDREPLFPEDFVKKPNGPICVELFEQHRGLFWVNTDFIDIDLLSNEVLPDEKLRNIDQIIEDYGQYSGGDLSELVRKEGPWLKTHVDNVMQKDVMGNYYRNLINNS